MGLFGEAERGKRFDRNRRQMAGFAGLGGILMVGVLYFCFYIPLTPGRLERASTALFPDLALWQWFASFSPPLATDAVWVAAGLLATGTAMFIAYALAVYWSWNRRASVRTLGWVAGVAGAMFVISTFALPNLNTDIFNYITRARVSTVYDSNPHYVPASDFPQDPIAPYASERIAHIVGDKLALWTWISMPLARLAGDSPTANLLMFRAAFLLFNLANIYLIYRILNRIAPRHVLAGLILYAWNPIVLVLGQSKTDTVMVFFLLVGVLLLVSGRARLASAALAASVLIKLITLPLVAIYWTRELWQRHWKLVAASILSFSTVVVITNLPLWQGPELILNHLWVGLGEAGASTAKSGMLKRFLLLPIVAGLLLSVGFTKDKSDLALLRRWAVVMLFFALFLSRISHAWYLMTPIAVVALSKDWRISVVTIAATYSAFMFYVWYATSTRNFPLPHLFDQPRFVIFMIPAALAILAAAGYMIVKRYHPRNPVVMT